MKKSYSDNPKGNVLMVMIKSFLSLGVVGSLLLAAANSALAQDNLVANSSFEKAREGGTLIGWNIGPQAEGLAVDKSTFYHGKSSLHLTLGGNATSISQTQYTRLQPGKRYTLSAYVKTNALDPTAGLQIMVINLGWSFGTQTKLQIDQATGDWKRYSRTFVVPPASQFKYRGQDNDQYKVMIYAKATGQVWIDAVQLEESSSATTYKPLETEAGGEGVQDTVANEIKSFGLVPSNYFQVKEPLFETLLSDRPGPQHTMYYGYNDLYADIYREYALKFGHRYVLSEQYQELLDHKLIPMTNAWARGGVGSYPTMRMILRPEPTGDLPAVLGTKPWMMDPRWQEKYVQAAVTLAKQSLDNSPDNKWDNSWGLWAGDEIFESHAIKIVPKDKRYPQVEEANKEIKEKYGFGKFGMPDSEDDPNIFARIAYRRWVSATLAQTYKRTYEEVKKINPQLKMLGPDQSGAVPPIDYDAITSYFDFIVSQSWFSTKPFVRQLATGADTKALADLSHCPACAE